MKKNIKIKDLTKLLEDQVRSISEVKMRIIILTKLNKIEFKEEDKAKFDDAINSLNSMITSVYSGVDIKVPFKSYSDKAPLFNGNFELKEGYNLDTQMSLCKGILSKALIEIESIRGLIQYLDPKSMRQVKFEDEFKENLSYSIESIKESLTSIESPVIEEKKVEAPVIEEKKVEAIMVEESPVVVIIAPTEKVKSKAKSKSKAKAKSKTKDKAKK